MSDNKNKLSRVLELLTEMIESEKGIKALLIGRRVRIISNYNGQPYGHSKKPLTGLEFVIEGVQVDTLSGINLRAPTGHRLYLGIEEVEFLDA